MEINNIDEMVAKKVADKIESGIKKTIKKLGYIDTGALYKSIDVRYKKKGTGYYFQVLSKYYIIYVGWQRNKMIMKTFFKSAEWANIRTYVSKEAATYLKRDLVKIFGHL